MAPSGRGGLLAFVLVGLVTGGLSAPPVAGDSEKIGAPPLAAAAATVPGSGTPHAVAGIPLAPGTRAPARAAHQASASQAAPDTAGYSIAGTVQAAGGSAMSNVYVEADSTTDSSVYYSTYSAADGSYSIDGVPSDFYEIWFRDETGTHFDGYYGGGGAPVAQISASQVAVTNASVTGINTQMQAIAPWTIQLQASATALPVGTDVVLTAKINQDVWPTNFYVSILRDDGTGWYCEFGIVCYVSDSMAAAGSTTYHAVVSLPDGTSVQATSSSVMVTWGSGSTYNALAPARILDTRSGTGLSGPFTNHVSRSFQVTGQGGVPAGATAVTGNLTVTGQTSNGYLFIGPAQADDPTSSALNFPIKDDRANGVTVALSSDGKLWVTFVAPSYGPTAQVIFDVTGYFKAGGSGSTYNALAPARILDTRSGTGLSGPFTNHVSRSFQVTGQGGVPAGATAVTGNLTVTGQTSNGYLFIGPAQADDPTSSALNFPIKDDRANGVTVALSSDGKLWVTFVAPSYGPTAQVIFDVTGYFKAGGSGSTYNALAPARILDTRSGTGLSGPFTNHVSRSFQVTGQGGVPAGATAVTGNLTVTGQTSNGYLFIGPAQADDPTSSALNFPIKDDRANGVTVALSSDGKLWVTFVAPSYGPTAQVIFDVTGYFKAGGSGSTLIVTPTLGDIQAGTSQVYTSSMSGTNVSSSTALSIVAGPAGVMVGTVLYLAGATVPGASCSGSSCEATAAGLYAVTGTDGGVSSPSVLLSVGGSTASSLEMVGLPSSTSVGTIDNDVIVAALDQYGNLAEDYTGLVYFSSSDPFAALPMSYTFTVSDAGVHRFLAPNGMRFGAAGTQWVSVTDSLARPAMTYTVSGIAVAGSSADWTFHSLLPARLLDTRNGTGLSGPFSADAARNFQVAGQGDVPANAVAVAGNLTVTGQTSGGFLSAGPVATNYPLISSLTFSVVENLSNAVTLPLDPSGTLSVTYGAPTGASTQAIFDVTGYFTADATGATYTPLVPARLLDTHNSIGLTGAFATHVARTFQVSGQGGVPANATAVTGQLTAANQTSVGYLYIGPTAQNNPTSSQVSFAAGVATGNGVAVGLGSGGTLSVTFVAPNSGNTSDVVFDVTGYFAP